MMKKKSKTFFSINTSKIVTIRLIMLRMSLTDTQEIGLFKNEMLSTISYLYLLLFKQLFK